MKKGKNGEIRLTREETKWLKENYATTKNAYLADRLGMGMSTLHKFAKKYGLKKDPDIQHQWSMENIDKMLAYNESTGYMAQSISLKRQHKEYMQSGRKWRGGKKGTRYPLSPELEALRVKRAREVRNKGIARDKRRVSLGLEPLGRLVHAVKMSRWETSYRYDMRKIGYVTFKDDSVIYYSEKTTRNLKRETNGHAHGLQILSLKKRITN